MVFDPKATELLLYHIRNYPTSSSLPQAYLRLGQIAQKGGRWEEAKFYFDKIKEEFPLSFEAKFVPSAAAAEESFFTVQLGSFGDLDNARKLKNELEGKDYSPYIVEVKDAESTFYRVRVGKLNSKAEAEYLAGELKKKGFEAKIYP